MVQLSQIAQARFRGYYKSQLDMWIEIDSDLNQANHHAKEGKETLLAFCISTVRESSCRRHERHREWHGTYQPGPETRQRRSLDLELTQILGTPACCYTDETRACVGLLEQTARSSPVLRGCPQQD